MYIYIYNIYIEVHAADTMQEQMLKPSFSSAYQKWCRISRTRPIKICDTISVTIAGGGQSSVCYLDQVLHMFL